MVKEIFLTLKGFLWMRVPVVTTVGTQWGFGQVHNQRIESVAMLQFMIKTQLF